MHASNVGSDFYILCMCKIILKFNWTWKSLEDNINYVVFHYMAYPKNKFFYMEQIIHIIISIDDVTLIVLVTLRSCLWSFDRSPIVLEFVRTIVHGVLILDDNATRNLCVNKTFFLALLRKFMMNEISSFEK